MASMNKNRRRGFGFAVSALGLLAACSVDTSDVNFVDDDVLSMTTGATGDTGSGGVPVTAGVANVGGVVNVAGVLNKAGSSGKAGASTGGSNATAGAPSGGMSGGGMPSGGMGAGGGPPAGGYPCKVVRPGKLIADFNALVNPMESWKDSTGAVDMGFYAYPPEAMPTIKVGDGALTVEARGVNKPSGFGIWFSSCLDAKAAGFVALRFNAKGTWTKGPPMTLKVAIHTNATTFADPAFQSGGCVPPMGENMTWCRPATTEVAILPPDAMPAPGPIVVPLTSFRNGNPAAQLDPTQIKAVEWGFIYLNGDAAFNANIVIDDVSFQ